MRFFSALFLADDRVCREYRIMLSTSPRQSLHTAISSPRRHSFCSHCCCCINVKAFLKPLLKLIKIQLICCAQQQPCLTHLRSNVLQFECGRDCGLCCGKLLGPSMLRDMIEFRSDCWLSLALNVEVVMCVDEETPLLMVQREFG